MRFRKATSIVFVVLAAGLLCSVVGLKVASKMLPDIVTWPTASEIEGRTLTEMPCPSVETCRVGGFQKTFESYLSDHVPGRDVMVHEVAAFKWLVLHDTVTKRVIIGDDGWLFYDSDVAESSGQRADYIGELMFTDDELAKIRSNVREVRSALGAQNREMAVLIAPNKETVYGKDFLPSEYGELADRRRMDQVADLLQEEDVITVDAREPILAAQAWAPAELYYKTDTHWNALGAYSATRVLFERLGITVPEVPEFSATAQKGGDLAKMMMLPELFDDTAYTVAFDCNRDGRSAFIVHDSFVGAMRPFLEGAFKESEFLHWNDYSRQDVLDSASDVVVFVTVERYLNRFVSRL